MLICPACGDRNPLGQRYCNQCGGALAQPTAPTIHVGREASDNPGERSLLIPERAGQVSRHQARVHVGPHGSLHLENLSKANGTKVNGLLVGQRTPFKLTDKVEFGSFHFNTAELQPYLSGAVPKPQSKPVVTPPPPQRNLTYFDRMLQDESPWMRGFLLAYGIILIVLFFLPIVVIRGDVVSAITVLGESRVSGWVKLALLFLPVAGVGLLVMRSMRVGQVVSGAALITAAVVGLGIIAGMDAGPRHLSFVGGWRFAFRWLFVCGTVCGLMCVAARPRDIVARTLLGVFAPMLALTYMFPLKIMGKSTIELVSTIQALERAPGWLAAFLVLGLVPFLVALGSLGFLSPSVASQRRGGAQFLAVFLAALPALTALLAFVFLAIAVEKPIIVLTGVWIGLYSSYLYLFPALGGALLFLGLRRRGAR